MAITDLLEHNVPLEYMNRQLEIWGQPCTVYIPENIVALGYESTTKKDIELLNSQDYLANKYRKYQNRIWINFTPTKSVFYKFNWFPDDADELCTAFMPANSYVRENSYIRTTVPEQTSIWGDMLFQVVKTADTGIGKTLKRTYFLKPTNNKDLQDILAI